MWEELWKKSFTFDMVKNLSSLSWADCTRVKIADEVFLIESVFSKVKTSSSRDINRDCLIRLNLRVASSMIRSSDRPGKFSSGKIWAVADNFEYHKSRAVLPRFYTHFVRILLSKLVPKITIYIYGKNEKQSWADRLSFRTRPILLIRFL